MASVNDLPLWEAEVSEILDVIPPPIGEDEVLKIHLSAKWFLKKKDWLIQVNRLHDLFFYLLDFITSAFVSVCLADANIHHSNHKAVLRIKAKDKILINKSRFLCPILTWFPEFKLLCGWYQLSIVKVIQFNLVLLLLPLFCMKALPTNFNFDNNIFFTNQTANSNFPMAGVATRTNYLETTTYNDDDFSIKKKVINSLCFIELRNKRKAALHSVLILEVCFH